MSGAMALRLRKTCSEVGGGVVIKKSSTLDALKAKAAEKILKGACRRFSERAAADLSPTRFSAVPT